MSREPLEEQGGAGSDFASIEDAVAAMGRGEIIVVPTVNPIGQSQLVGNTHVGRYDLLSRDNFNRNWLDLSGAVAERVGATAADGQDGRLAEDEERQLEERLRGLGYL